MKVFLSLIFICCFFRLPAQVIDISQPPQEPFENIKAIQVYSDSLATTFIIYIKHEVALHKHEWHTEQVYILEGTASMRLGDKWFDIKANDFIVIPQNTLHAVKVTSSTPLKVMSIQSPYFDGTDRVMITE